MARRRRWAIRPPRRSSLCPQVTRSRCCTTGGLVDDDWCTFGSFNVIGTSASLTIETNLQVCAPAFVATMARRFEDDLRRSRPINARVLADRGPLTRSLDYGARLLLGGVNHLLPAVGL